MQANVVIVGGGHAGGMTAIFLRQINYSGSIIVIGEEEFLPYQRPSLSKGFLSAEIEEKRLYLKSDNFYKKNNISMICNTHVKDILKDQKKIILDDGKVINFDNLVLCTGSIVKKIDYPELESNILYLRDIKDSLKIRDIIKNNKKIAIIGAGYIGLEIASIIRKNKINTTIIELENRLMKRVASKELASYFEARHRDEGVQFKLQTSIGSMYKKGQKINIECSDNSIISSDIVIAGIGVLPNVTLAVNMGLKCNNGIVVDEFCQTSHKNIFAAGDCTNHHNHIFKKNVKLESVHNAVEQAKTVAYMINGEQKPYNQVPWFWSDQYDIKLQIAGLIDDNNEKIIRGSLKEDKFSVFLLKNGRLLAVESVNSPKDFIIGRKLIGSQCIITREQIEDVNFDLKDLINK